MFRGGGPPRRPDGRRAWQRVQIGASEPQVGNEPEDDHYDDHYEQEPRAHAQDYNGPLRGTYSFTDRSNPRGGTRGRRGRNQANVLNNNRGRGPRNPNGQRPLGPGRPRVDNSRNGNIYPRYIPRGGYFGLGSRGTGSKGNKSQQKGSKKKGKKRNKNAKKTAFADFKEAITNLELEGDLDDCYTKITTSTQQAAVASSATQPPSFIELVEKLTKEVKEEVDDKETGSDKNTQRAINDGSLGQIMTSVVKFEDEKKLPQGGWRKMLRRSVVHFSKAICKLPSEAEMTQEEDKLKLSKATYDLYYSRAQAYCMLQRYSDFWSDALVALSLCPYAKQMELLGSLVEKRIEQVRRSTDPRKKKNARVSDTALKNWREETRASLKRAEDCLLLQAILDQQNDHKLNRLMGYYAQIAQLRKERLVEDDTRKPPTENSDKKAATNKTYMATNIFDNVEVDTAKNQLLMKEGIAKNKIIFYEQVIAFEAGPTSAKNMPIRHCGNCFRRLNIAKALPCNSCSDAVFCNAGCRKIAESSTHRHLCKIGTRVRAKLSKNSYLAFQLMCYSNFSFLEGIQEKDVYHQYFVKPTLMKNAKAKGDDWPRYAVVAAIQKRTTELDNNYKMSKKDQHLLADAMYLSKLLVQITNKSKEPKIQDDKSTFKAVLKVLWAVHRDPLASSRLGMNKDIALCPFGSLLEFNCKPNVKRKFNPKKGRVEYQARTALEAKTVLMVDWGSLFFFKDKSQLGKKKRKDQVAQGANGQPSQVPEATAGTATGATAGTSTSQTLPLEQRNMRSELIEQMFSMKHTCCSETAGNSVNADGP